MTIASHCLDLLRVHGPMTAEDLGEACRTAGVSAARDPALSVRSALGWSLDGRFVRLGEHFQLVDRLLDGRWLTLPAPEDSAAFRPGLDLRCLLGLAQRDGIPLHGGGVLRGSRHGFWTGPRGWAPDDGLVGLRLVDGQAEVAPIHLDETAAARGAQLTERVLAGCPVRYGQTDHGSTAMIQSLLVRLHEDESFLRDPVAPLHELLPVEPPAPAGGSGWSPWLPDTSFRVSLPPWVQLNLVDAADRAGMDVADWVADELARLMAWPGHPVDAPHNRPAHDGPVYDHPTYDHPVYDHPVYDHPRYDQPRYDHPRYPTYDGPGYDDRWGDDPIPDGPIPHEPEYEGLWDDGRQDERGSDVPSPGGANRTL